VVESSSRAQRGVLAEVLDAELGKLLDGVLDEVAENRLIVVADEDYFADIGDFRQRFQAVANNGVTGDVE
jgi:hypothetical protein